MNDPGTIPAFLDRRPLVGSYTNMHCFEDICAYQAYRRYVLKDIVFVPTKESEFGNAVHTAFELRVGGGKPLPLEMADWERFAAPFDGRGAKVEQKLGLTVEGKACGFFDNNVRFRVKVDLAIVNGGTCYMADWKSGSSKYEDPFELAIGAMHLHALHPSLTKIVGNYVWLKENRVGQLYNLSETNKTWEKANRILSKMETAKTSGDWPKRKSGLCGWCPVLDCEHNTSEQRK